MKNTKNIIEIQNINKYFGEGENRVHILKNISLSIEKGDFVSIIGQSGSGKSTLMNIIGCLDKATSGKYYIDGEDISNFTPDELSELRKRKFGFIFQRYHLLSSLNAQENVALPAIYAGVDHDNRMERAKKLLEKLELSNKLKNKPNQLSGGQQQRVSIARALINKPGVLLLDEPLSALDAKLRQNLLIELDLIHDEVGITFIFITHDQQEALSISDRIAVMNAGKVLQVGTPAEVYEAPADTFVADFLGENNFFSGKVTEIINEELAKINLEGIGEIIIELDKKVNIGDKVTISLRPEKIRLSKKEIKSTKNFVNSAAVYVDEYIYSGFQSKYYVHLKNNENLKFKIFMQHAAFFDDNDEKAIWWDEDAYITWDAYDGYLVEVESEKK